MARLRPGGRGGVERVTGTSDQQNFITGDAGPNKLIGGLAIDVLKGGGGADVLRGERAQAPSGARDLLEGGDGRHEQLLDRRRGHADQLLSAVGSGSAAITCRCRGPAGKKKGGRRSAAISKL